MQALLIEADMLVAASSPNPTIPDVLKQVHLDQGGALVLETGRPLGSDTQIAGFKIFAESAYALGQWSESVQWYWRLFAILPGNVDDGLRRHYYRSLGYIDKDRADELNSVRLLIAASKSFWMAGEIAESYDVVGGLIGRDNLSQGDQAWLAFIRGQHAELESDKQSALEYYQESLQTNAGFPFAAFARPDLIATAFSKFDAHSYGWLRGVASPLLEKDIDLKALIIDEDVLGMGLDVPIATLWKLPSGAKFDSSETDNVVAIQDGYWIHFEVAPNEIRNGGFEWTLPEKATSIVGWIGDNVKAPSFMSVQDALSLREGRVGRFESNLDGSQAIFLARRPITTQKNELYLGGAAVRVEPSDSGPLVTSWAGIWWKQSIGWFLSSDSDVWISHYQIVRGPDEIETIPIGVWVIPNRHSVGNAYWDSLFLIPLPRIVTQG